MGFGIWDQPIKNKEQKNLLPNGKMFKMYNNTFLEVVQAPAHACHPHTWCWVPLGGDSPQRSWCAPALGKIGLKRKVSGDELTCTSNIFLRFQNLFMACCCNNK
jgi:hypothetical protein